MSEFEVHPPVSALSVRREEDGPIFDFGPVTKRVSMWWWFLASIPVQIAILALIGWALP